MIAITGATGQLGTLVLKGLLAHYPAGEVIAAVRTPAKAQAWADKGVQVREADYSRPETLEAAFRGAGKVLLISGTELGSRVPQHRAVVDAAKSAGVSFVAYTSLLHADTSSLRLAQEHLATEAYLRASGLAFALLRNGWYAENLSAGTGPALEQGAFLGASGNGRFAAATRAEYAAAAVAVLAAEAHADRVYELAGDTPFTRAELAGEVSRQTGKVIGYHDLPEAEYGKILANFLPPDLASIIADAEARAAEGALDDSSHDLSRLIGRRTLPLSAVVAEALEAAGGLSSGNH